MGRWIDNQQEHINNIQKELDRAREARRIITAIWPLAGSKTARIPSGDPMAESSDWGFTVRLQEHGHVWGQGEHEHLAWLAAWNSLTDRGVLEAEVIRAFIQKMDTVAK